MFSDKDKRFYSNFINFSSSDFWRSSCCVLGMERNLTNWNPGTGSLAHRSRKPRIVAFFLFLLHGCLVLPAAASMAMNVEEISRDQRTGLETDLIKADHGETGSSFHAEGPRTTDEILPGSDLVYHSERNNPQRPKSLLLPKMKICWFPLNRAYYS